MKDLLSAIYNTLLRDTEWIIKHAALMSLVRKTPREVFKLLLELLDL